MFKLTIWTNHAKCTILLCESRWNVMPTEEAKQRAKDKYLKEKVDTVLVRVPKGKKAVIQGYAAAHGESVNAFINRAINEAMEK